MPYIPKEDRERLRLVNPDTSGELAWALTWEILIYARRKGTPRFTDFAEVLGVLEAVKLELYRRLVTPYENTKCFENGDVYENGEVS